MAFSSPRTALELQKLKFESKKRRRSTNNPAIMVGILWKNFHMYMLNAPCARKLDLDPVWLQARSFHHDSRDERGVILGAIPCQAGICALEKQCLCNPTARGQTQKSILLASRAAKEHFIWWQPSVYDFTRAGENA